MTIQAVLFDMGGTLQTFWHTRELRLDATPGLRQILEKAGLKLSLNDEQLYQRVADGLEAYHCWAMESVSELPALRVWREYILNGLIDPALLNEQNAEELMFYVETRYYQRTMRPEIPEVLRALRGMGLKIGLISNAVSHGQVPANLREYGIYEYFDPIVISSEYGRRKPDPAIFHYAARLAKTPASQCAYVGDRINRDIVGARRAGYRLAVQIEHDFKHGESDEGAAPDEIIRDMHDLIGLLQREQREQPLGAVQANPDPRQVKAILFDAGDILYYRPSCGVKIRPFLLEVTGKPFAPLPDEVGKELNDRAYTGQISQRDFRREILRYYGVTRPEQVERGLRIMEEESNNVIFFPGVRETLITLKQAGYFLGIITDTAHDVSVKLAWFEKGGFGQVWDSIISSKEIGVRKPDARIYQAALDQLGLAAAQAVFVGHKASELDGARAVGMRTIAFNYEPAARADVYIQHFTDLPRVPLLQVHPQTQESAR